MLFFFINWCGEDSILLFKGNSIINACKDNIIFFMRRRAVNEFQGSFGMEGEGVIIF